MNNDRKCTLTTSNCRRIIDLRNSVAYFFLPYAIFTGTPTLYYPFEKADEQAKSMPGSSSKKTKPAKTLEELLGSSSDSDSDGFALDTSPKDQGGSSDDTFAEIPVLASPKKKKTALSTKPPTTSKTKNKVPASTAAKAVSPTADAMQQAGDEDEDDSFAVVLPTSWMATGQPPPGDCNVLIQVDPEDAARLDYEGTSGAIGRFEAGPCGIILDLKGRQYQGSLLPGPTAMMVALAKGKQLRLEGLTDEFATLVQTQDVMAKLDAIVTGAQMDEGYKVVEENVNRVERNKGDTGKDAESQKGTTEAKHGGVLVPSRGASKPAAKRRKKSTT